MLSSSTLISSTFFVGDNRRFSKFADYLFCRMLLSVIVRQVGIQTKVIHYGRSNSEQKKCNARNEPAIIRNSKKISLT
jgi:hypothetical protein